MRAETSKLYSNPVFLCLSRLAREVYRLQLELPPEQHTALMLSVVIRAEPNEVDTALAEITKSGLLSTPTTKQSRTPAERARAYRERKRDGVTVERDVAVTPERDEDVTVPVTRSRDEDVTVAKTPAKTKSTKPRRHTEVRDGSVTERDEPVTVRDAVTQNVTPSVTPKEKEGVSLPESLSLPPPHTPSLSLSPNPSLFQEKESSPAPAGKPPMPWTITEMLSVLHEESGGKVVVAPFVKALASPLTKVIRELAEQSVSLDDLRTVGAWIKSGGMDWMAEGPGLNWLAKTGNLADAVGKARTWKVQAQREQEEEDAIWKPLPPAPQWYRDSRPKMPTPREFLESKGLR